MIAVLDRRGRRRSRLRADGRMHRFLTFWSESLGRAQRFEPCVIIVSVDKYVWWPPWKGARKLEGWRLQAAFQYRNWSARGMPRNRTWLCQHQGLGSRIVSI